MLSAKYRPDDELSADHQALLARFREAVERRDDERATSDTPVLDLGHILLCKPRKMRAILMGQAKGAAEQAATGEGAARSPRVAVWFDCTPDSAIREHEEANTATAIPPPALEPEPAGDGATAAGPQPEFKHGDTVVIGGYAADSQHARRNGMIGTAVNIVALATGYLVLYFVPSI